MLRCTCSWSAAWPLLLALSSCADDGSPEPSDAGGAREVPCIDQSIEQLTLFEVPAEATILEDTATGEHFESLIDATGGGVTPAISYTYVRFTEDGLEQLAIGDEEAFESTAWHLALRRYVLRVNSGVSGPGDVRVGRTAPMTDFEAVDRTPEGLAYRVEQYLTEACDLVPDGSGLGAPGTALASFWSYSGCVAMTGNVYVLDLGDGARVKLEVLAYYPEENQAICQETDAVPMPSGAGQLRIRWAFID